ncbi:MAG: hypothetical protein QMD85_04245, partial [Candidatus Aenigmarchaeota archaeon]|nr:hypothetical protein [Candidatus Aenigmarchaeota archaeon]MDI6722780.1 hypothetical protein [Candidatus Aenigmarchaeota archaeon]
MYLTEADERMLNGTISIMKRLFDLLRDMPVEEAVRDLKNFDKRTQEKYSRKDRKDTRFFDIVAEDAISLGDGCCGHMDHMLKAYNQMGVMITEECGRVPREIRIEHNTPTIISDPVDSTSYFDDIMKRLGTKGDRVGTAFDRELDRVGEARARRHACNTSVTLMKDNEIKYTAVLNLLTGDIYIGSAKGVYRSVITSVNTATDLSIPLEFNDAE